MLSVIYRFSISIVVIIGSPFPKPGCLPVSLSRNCSLLQEEVFSDATRKKMAEQCSDAESKTHVEPNLITSLPKPIVVHVAVTILSIIVVVITVFCLIASILYIREWR